MEYSAVLYSYVFYSSLCMTQVCCDRTFPPSNCLRTIASMFLSAKEIIARYFQWNLLLLAQEEYGKEQTVNAQLVKFVKFYDFFLHLHIYFICFMCGKEKHSHSTYLCSYVPTLAPHNYKQPNLTYRCWTVTCFDKYFEFSSWTLSPKKFKMMLIFTMIMMIIMTALIASLPKIILVRRFPILKFQTNHPTTRCNNWNPSTITKSDISQLSYYHYQFSVLSTSDFNSNLYSPPEYIVDVISSQDERNGRIARWTISDVSVKSGKDLNTARRDLLNLATVTGFLSIERFPMIISYL